MQRLVEVGPGHGYEIFDASRHRPPQVVNDAEHGVAILHGRRDHAHGAQIVDLLDRDALPLQLFVDTEQPLDPAFDGGSDARFFQLVT